MKLPDSYKEVIIFEISHIICIFEYLLRHLRDIPEVFIVQFTTVP